MDKVAQFNRDCHANYLADIRRAIPSFPRRYEYPDGNPIRPVLPVQKSPQRVMVIGAFPSARFERREGRLIPVADNLSPFGAEVYFDGREVRIQESANSLQEQYLDVLGLDREQLWITDIVKVYLYPEKHIRNCNALFPRGKFVNTHRAFREIALASREWFLREMEACNPDLVITLGEVCARVVSLDKSSKTSQLLDGRIREITPEKPFKVIHLAHPEIRRRNQKWNEITRRQIDGLKPMMRKYV